MKKVTKSVNIFKNIRYQGPIGIFFKKALYRGPDDVAV